MRKFVLLVSGFGIGFGIAAATIAALVLFGIGVGGHYLVVNDAGVAGMISFDPSTVAARAPFPAAVAICLAICFLVIWIRLGRNDHRADRSQQLRNQERA